MSGLQTSSYEACEASKRHGKFCDDKASSRAHSSSPEAGTAPAAPAASMLEARGSDPDQCVGQNQALGPHSTITRDPASTAPQASQSQQQGMPAQRLHTLHSQHTPLTPPLAASADTAHRQGVQHRAVTPCVAPAADAAFGKALGNSAVLGSVSHPPAQQLHPQAAAPEAPQATPPSNSASLHNSSLKGMPCAGHMTTIGKRKMARKSSSIASQPAASVQHSSAAAREGHDSASDIKPNIAGLIQSPAGGRTEQCAADVIDLTD